MKKKEVITRSVTGVILKKSTTYYIFFLPVYRKIQVYK